MTESTRTRPLRVVGLDPGLANLGLGAVEERGKTYRLLGTELVRTSSGRDQATRLEHVYRAVCGFLDLHEPHALAIEGQFFHRQRDVSFKVGQAFGVCLLAAEQRGVAVYEYGPMQVKQALVGNGRASKGQVAFMVRGILELDARPSTGRASTSHAPASRVSTGDVSNRNPPTTNVPTRQVSTRHGSSSRGSSSHVSSSHIADALALALTHFNHRRLAALTPK